MLWSCIKTSICIGGKHINENSTKVDDKFCNLPCYNNPDYHIMCGSQDYTAIYEIIQYGTENW